ncbi:MAG: hypothetical protein JRE07_01940 [Deltaproteobacteria bacterium]|nr:hypothetical protein [Deltaproteobacteria bacterium]
MGKIKQEDIICWQDQNGRILCEKCHHENVESFPDITDDKAVPITDKDVYETDYIYCDQCKERVQ